MWIWNEDLRHSVRESDPNKYVVVESDVFILYPKFVPRNNFVSLTRDKTLCYLCLVGESPLLKHQYSRAYDEPCDICGRKTKQPFRFYTFGNYTILRCPSCELNNSTVDVFVQHKEIQNYCGFLNKSRHNIDATFLKDEYIVFLYRYKSPKYTFNYESMIPDHRYGYVPKINTCTHCNRNSVYINSYCESCYDFAYQLSQLNKVFLFGSVFDCDTFNNILFYYIKSLNINMPLANILAIKNKCRRIVDQKEEILENLYFSDVDYDKDDEDEDSTEFYESITDY